ncbi:hypothetical protein J3E72DRAFT_273823 [Bipolaris maydis]|nr:hypothetical protein J3E72DRAFT_273823 [Bipolaris maydis]
MNLTAKATSLLEDCSVIGTTRGSDFAGTIIAMSPEATEERSDLSLGRLRSGYCTLAVCSLRSFELAKSYGADYVFDYSNPDTPLAIRKLIGGALSLVLDCILDHHSIAVCYASTG